MRFVDIGGIVDHHCLEVIIRFVDIGGIVEHHCLEVIVRCFVDIGRIVCFTQFLCYTRHTKKRYQSLVASK